MSMDPCLLFEIIVVDILCGHEIDAAGFPGNLAFPPYIQQGIVLAESPESTPSQFKLAIGCHRSHTEREDSLEINEVYTYRNGLHYVY